MKKFFITAMMIVAAVSMNAVNYFAIDQSDTIRLRPQKLDGYTQHVVGMNIDGMADTWQIRCYYPDGLFPKLVAGTTPLEGMTITYNNHTGYEETYEAPLNVSYQYATISSHIEVDGYWDYNQDGVFESYGTAKWLPGYHEMFEFNFYVDPAFRRGWVILDGTIDSSSDKRGAILDNVIAYKRVWFWVGYMPGDVSGSERLDISDVTMLIDHLLDPQNNSAGLDEFQLAACDFNRDGQADIADVTGLIDALLRGQTTN